MDAPQYLPSNLPSQAAAPVQQAAPTPLPAPVHAVAPPVQTPVQQMPPAVQYSPPRMKYETEQSQPEFRAEQQAAPIYSAPLVMEYQPPAPEAAAHAAPPVQPVYAAQPAYETQPAQQQMPPAQAGMDYRQESASMQYQQEPAPVAYQPAPPLAAAQTPQQAAQLEQQVQARARASRTEFTPLPSPVVFEPQPQHAVFQPLAAEELFKARDAQNVQNAQPVAAKVIPSEFVMHRDPSLNADAELDAALEQILRLGASDLHIAVNAPPMMRIDGALRALPDAPIWTEEKVTAALLSILTPVQLEKFREELEFDFAYTLSASARFRVNFFQQRDNIGAAFRAIPTEIKSLRQLGVPDSIANFAQLARGLVLVTGPTGSGKSTTLAGLIDLVNRNRADHIVTVEDPIEFLHVNQKALINQREVGHDTHSFGAALKHVLRQDPDVILVGELRDLETISVALTAAETGHLVFATLHTSDAPQTIDRIIDVYPPHQQSQVRAQLAATLQGVVCQTLIKKASGKGRVVATEVLVRTSAVANLIREGKTFQIHSAMQAGRDLGMHTIDQHLADLVNTGQITMDAAKEKAHDHEILNRLVTGAHAQAATGGIGSNDRGYGVQS